MLANSSIPPFYFSVVFWGKEYRDYFLNCLVASLLAPRNILVLDNKADARFLIAAPRTDWQAIQHEPIFQQLINIITPIWVEIPTPDSNDPNAFANKMVYMSKAHKIMTDMIYKQAAIGVFPTPDLVLSNGAIETLQRYAYLGKKVVVTLAIRFEHHGCMQAFRDGGYMQRGKPLVISSRELVAIAIKNFHSETIRYQWDKNYYAQVPVTSLWPLTKDRRNYVVHTFSLSPLMTNYAGMSKHDTSTFDGWTMDGDYLYKNYGEDSDVHLITDSDECVLLSFTKEEDLHIPAIPESLQKVPIVAEITKQIYFSCLFHSDTMDPLKRRLVLDSVYFHADPLTPQMKNIAMRICNKIRCATQRYNPGNIPKMLEWLKKIKFLIYISHPTNLSRAIIKRCMYRYIRIPLYIITCILHWKPRVLQRKIRWYLQRKLSKG